MNSEKNTFFIEKIVKVLLPCMTFLMLIREPLLLNYQMKVIWKTLRYGKEWFNFIRLDFLKTVFTWKFGPLWRESIPPETNDEGEPSVDINKRYLLVGLVKDLKGSVPTLESSITYNFVVTYPNQADFLGYENF